MTRKCLVLLIAALSLMGCTSRSISDSGYRDPNSYRGGASNPFYRGELTPFEVLGIDPQQRISQDDIDKALAAKQPFSVKKGSAIMLVQSGAAIPDNDMVGALERYYTVSSFSGVPAAPATGSNAPPPGAYALMYRLAAAKGGYEKIVVYWGVLETASEGLGSKAVSWVPIIGGVIPDEAQKMRIRLIIAVIDTKTGQWETLTPKPLDDDAISNQHNRGASDQQQVAVLKGQAYKAAAESLVERYGR